MGSIRILAFIDRQPSSEAPAKLLRQFLGDEWARRITWEYIAAADGLARDETDYNRIRRLLGKHKPAVVLTFGSVARSALNLVKYGEFSSSLLWSDWQLWTYLHPLAKGQREKVCVQLRELRIELDKL